MIFKPVIAENEITKLHGIFYKKLHEYRTTDIDAYIGHKGSDNNNFYPLTYSKELNIWWTLNKLYDRYWNAFGIGEPKNNKNVSMICGINYPLSDLNFRFAGLFVKNKSEYILTHSGKIGGGKEKIGKNLFLNNYINEYVQVDIKGKIKNYAAIGFMSSSRFAKQVSNFVKEIDRIKKINPFNNTYNFISGIKTDFTDEYFGTKGVKKVLTSETICDHGLVVNKLKEYFSEKGLKVANDINRDLYILNNDNSLNIVFEFKTDLTSQSIYTAVGQLLLNSTLIPYHVKKIIVIPEGLNQRIKDSLIKLKIYTLEYKWQDGYPCFIKVDMIL